MRLERLESCFKKASSWLRLLLHRREADQDLDDEIQFHLDAAAEQNLARGMTPEAARRAARIELGGIEQVKEKVRAARTGAWLEIFVQDLRFGLRMLRKSPGFTSIAVLILALGIGANTAIFSIINGLMLHTLPVRDPGQLIELLHQYPGEPAFNGFSWDAYKILRDGNRVFSDLIIGSTMNFGPVRGDNLQPQTVFVGSPSSRRELVILEVPIRSGSRNHRQENYCRRRRSPDYHWRDATWVLRTQRTSETRRLVACITWPIPGMGIPTIRATETARFHRTSPSEHGGAIPNGGQPP